MIYLIGTQFFWKFRFLSLVVAPLMFDPKWRSCHWALDVRPHTPVPWDKLYPPPETSFLISKTSTRNLSYIFCIIDVSCRSEYIWPAFILQFGNFSKIWWVLSCHFNVLNNSVKISFQRLTTKTLCTVFLEIIESKLHKNFYINFQSYVKA